jgi:DNA polymerase III delta prime subunit
MVYCLRVRDHGYSTNMKHIFVTGQPGVGKTTLCISVAQKLAKELKHARISGFYTEERRVDGERVCWCAGVGRRNLHERASVHVLTICRTLPTFFLSHAGVGRVRRRLCRWNKTSARQHRSSHKWTSCWEVLRGRDRIRGRGAANVEARPKH